MLAMSSDRWPSNPMTELNRDDGPSAKTMPAAPYEKVRTAHADS
jgi:hypothetical protein